MPRILVVDDNEENRELLARKLEHRGFDVVTAGDGHQGLEQAISERPDVILMDMNMPVLDGWQATQFIREHADYSDVRDTPIIAVTAHDQEGDREKIILAGCSDYHAKPVEFPQLMIQIENLIKNRTLPQETNESVPEPDDPIEL